MANAIAGQSVTKSKLIRTDFIASTSVSPKKKISLYGYYTTLQLRFKKKFLKVRDFLLIETAELLKDVHLLCWHAKDSQGGCG
jgi:hypothetical protein